jgi:23S rRNA pseudouridine1911/1915/1917 synthase
VSGSAPTDEEVWRHRVLPEEAGQRLDHLLVGHWPGRSRSWLQRLVREGRALLDGERVKTGARLEAGQEVELHLPPPTPSTVEPEDLPLRILRETESYLVVDKPAGMVVHPAAGHREGTLVAALLHRYSRLSREGGPDRPGIVHRLDKDTSGLLLVARDDRAHRRLAEQFRERTVRKRYVALVWGRLRENEGLIDRPVGRDPARRSRMAAGGLRPRPAETRWRRRESYPGFSLLDVDIRTGRTHQIRVHLSAVGYPIVGDASYGGRRWRGLRDPAVRKAVREFRRLALHAVHLQFDDPVTGERVAVDSPLPAEMSRLIEVIRS